MRAETKKINLSLMIGWTIIVAVLCVSYVGEVVKAVRTWDYVLVFMLVTVIPNLICHFLYHKWPESEKLRYYIVCGYFVMYTFCLLTGSTYMVFSYILPLLSLLILYHQPKLILWTGVAGIIFNLFSIMLKFANGELDLESSKNAEIQIALIILCFGGCYAATRIYDQIQKQNLEFMAELEEKNLQARQMTMQTVMTIVNTIDAKDEYTKGHSQRVSEYAVALAEELGMPEEEIERIRYVGLLHDIGKIGVPDAILNKPGRLNNTEFSLMKLHTMVGGEILKDINSMEDLDVGAKYHHERYDGKGYPEGLAGEDIPFVARIIGIADAYDAMTSHRVYRKRLSDEAVQEEIARCAGAQFDPKLAEVFLNMVKQGKLQSIDTDSYDAQDGSPDSIGGELLEKLLDDAGAYNSAENSKDGLTGVYNRIYGEQMLADYIKCGEGCLMAIDIDALRNTNNSYGFLRGDLHINTIANILERNFANKILYRNEGDQFICFLFGLTREDVAESEAKRLLQCITKTAQEDPELFDLSISVGFLIVHAGEFSCEEALNRVDRALYFAKQKGGGDWCNYQSLTASFQPKSTSGELQNLLQMIYKRDNCSKTYEVNYPEFTRTINYLERVVERNDQQMHVIMFTLLATDEESATIEQKITGMKMLEAAVLSSLRKTDVTMQFSSSQRIVVLMNMDEENQQLTINHIISAFYKSDINKMFSIVHEVADLSAIEDY